MIPSQNALDLIKKFEGLCLEKYLCPAGKLTIGYGHFIKENEKFDSITEAQAETLLKTDLKWVSRTIGNCLSCDLTQNEYDALCSFIFNIGGTNFRKSTMARLLNEDNYLDAADEFKRWVYIGKEVSNGLVKRREAEKELFMKETV